VTYLIGVYSLIRSVSLDRLVPVSYSIDKVLSTLDITGSDSLDLVYYIMDIATAKQCNDSSGFLVTSIGEALRFWVD
jgi:hypothetical protein